MASDKHRASATHRSSGVRKRGPDTKRGPDRRAKGDPDTRAKGDDTRAKDRPRLPSDVYRDLKAASGGDPDRLERLAADFAAAGVALEEGDTTHAIELLQRSKARAARSAVVREALGIALYLAGHYREAGRELSAYRRISGRLDQNHLLADSARANGQLDKAEALVAEMMQADVPADRIAEGLMVIAGARADQGDPRAALAALHRVDLSPRDVQPYHLRLWYLAGSLHEQLGEREQAAGLFNAITTFDPEFLDAAERAAALAVVDG
jgi:tetratricopeptide (TPR) repeat protein